MLRLLALLYALDYLYRYIVCCTIVSLLCHFFSMALYLHWPNCEGRSVYWTRLCRCCRQSNKFVALIMRYDVIFSFFFFSFFSFSLSLLSSSGVCILCNVVKRKKNKKSHHTAARGHICLTCVVCCWVEVSATR
jgi:hypothetical protein